MKSWAAVLFETGQKLEICELDVQDPGPGEVRIRMAAGGVCHSDLHVMTGHLSAPLPAVLKIPDDLPLERAALLGCAVITGVGAVVNAAQVRPGRTVAVFSIGGVGINVVQGAILAGAEKSIAVDLLESRLEHAKRFGATHAVNASAGDPVEQIRDLTGGKGADYAFEVVGLPVTMRQAYHSLPKRGVAMVVEPTPSTAEVTVLALSLVYKERVLTGSLYGSAAPKTDIPRLIDLYRAGSLSLDELLTRSYPLAEINQAYDALEPGETLRSVVTF